MGIFVVNDNADIIVRRSSRSNKGQHSKFGGVAGGARKKRKLDVVEDDDEEGEIRCLCDDNEDDGGFMIQCEKCGKWQHGGCMGYQNPEEVSDSYACELCRPDLYKDVSVEESKEGKSNDKKKKEKKEKIVVKI